MKYKAYRIVDGKPKWVVIDENGKVNKNPAKEELKGLEKEPKYYTRKYCTDEQLLNELIRAEKEYGRIPAERDFYKNAKYPSYKTYQQKFGSWNNALIAAGLKPNDIITRSRQAEIQTISEFKTEAIDLSGNDRHSTCDGICPRGELFDTKSSSLTRKHGYWGWNFSISIGQLEEADYLFLRAYNDKDFTKPPAHKWRIPIEFMNNRTGIFIYKDTKFGMYNVENMKIYEIK